jgi:hypothetical protein
MNRGLSDVLTESFPDLTPVERPLIEVKEIRDPN